MPVDRQRANDQLQLARRRRASLRRASLRGSVLGRQKGGTGAGGLAQKPLDLHPIAFDLLHGLDVLWRRRLRRPVGARIRYDLPWPDPSDDWLVGAAQAPCPHRPDAAHHLDRRHGVFAIRQVQSARRSRHGSGRRGHHPVHRASASIGDAQFRCVHARQRVGLRQPDIDRLLGGRRARRIHDHLRHPKPERERAAPWRRDCHRRRGGRQARRSNRRRCLRGLLGRGRADGYPRPHRKLSDQRLGAPAGPLGNPDLPFGGGLHLPAAHVPGHRRREFGRAAPGHGQLGFPTLSFSDEPVRRANRGRRAVCSAGGLQPRPLRSHAPDRLRPERADHARFSRWLLVGDVHGHRGRDRGFNHGFEPHRDADLA